MSVEVLRRLLAGSGIDERPAREAVPTVDSTVKALR
jgi:hypothetical protein